MTASTPGGRYSVKAPRSQDCDAESCRKPAAFCLVIFVNGSAARLCLEHFRVLATEWVQFSDYAKEPVQ